MSGARRGLLVIVAVAATGLQGCGTRGDASAGARAADPLPTARPGTSEPAPVAGAPARGPGGFGVTEVVGVAARDRGGQVQPLSVGDVIERSDAVTTGRSSQLRLADASGAHLQLQSSTELFLEPEGPGEAQGPRLHLRRGRVRATAAEGASLAVHAGGGAGGVESVGGDFTVQAEPGVVRVVPHGNKVTLRTRDDRVDILPGDGAEVAAGARPVVTRVPPSLLLRVRWPETPPAQRDRHLKVAGETSPGALVRAGNAEAIADASGRFAMIVPLHEGDNVPRVAVEDVAGRQRVSVGKPVRVDSTPPTITHGGIHY